MDYRDYNCTGSAFQTFQKETFEEVWNLKEYRRIAEAFPDDREERKNMFAFNLAEYVSQKFHMNCNKIASVDSSVPVGSIVLRIKDTVMSLDFHFVRKIHFDDEVCWLSKPGVNAEDIWFDDDVNSPEWINGYDSAMFLLEPITETIAS